MSRCTDCHGPIAIPLGDTFCSGCRRNRHNFPDTRCGRCGKASGSIAWGICYQCQLENERDRGHPPMDSMFGSFAGPFRSAREQARSDQEEQRQAEDKIRYEEMRRQIEMLRQMEITMMDPGKSFTVDSKGNIEHRQGSAQDKKLAESQRQLEIMTKKFNQVEGDKARLEMENVMLKMQVLAETRMNASKPKAAAGLDQDRIKQLITLCHPDKHANSETSTEATRWLLSQRKK